jgi:pSer/pThr/pTyr-binding forkhead associated (FHA) protein
MQARAMAREDFAIEEHSVIFSPRDKLRREAQPAAPGEPQPGGAAGGARKARAQLILLEDATAKPFAVDEQFVVGRSGDLRLGDTRVSRRHARIFAVDGAYKLEDLGSANGTFLNEQKVLAPARLRSGDIIRVGPFEMRFVLDASAPRSELAAAGRQKGPASPKGPPSPEASLPTQDSAPAVPASAPRFAHEPTPQSKPEEQTPAEAVAGKQVSPIDLTDRQAASADGAFWVAARLGNENLGLLAGDGMPLSHTLRVGDSHLTGQAATLARRADGYWLEPAPGADAVLLNGAEVTAPVRVRPGDNLQLGPLAIAFETRR